MRTFIVGLMLAFLSMSAAPASATLSGDIQRVNDGFSQPHPQLHMQISSTQDVFTATSRNMSQFATIQPSRSFTVPQMRMPAAPVARVWSNGSFTH